MNKWWIVPLLIAWADLIEGGCNVPSIKRLNFYNSIEILNGSTRTLSCEIHSDTKLHKDLPFSGWKRDYPPHLPIEYSLGNASCSVSPNTTCIVSNLTLINVIRGEYDGKYSLTAENDCGTATVYVFVNIMVLPKCLNNYYRPPLLKIPPPPIVQAVQGTSVIIKAIYAGHYDDNLLAFWCVLKRDGDYHCFYPNDNTTVYNVTTNGCLPPNFDCCYFIISIEIQSLTFDLSGAKLTSMAGWKQPDPSYCVGNSTLTVNPYPTLYKTYPNASSHCIELNEGQSTEFTCIYHASADPNVTITTWKFNEELLEQNNSSHYTVVTKYGIDPLHRNSVLSRLILSNLKPDNAGIYTCQCVYSSNVYVNGKDNIGSEAASFCVKVDPGKTWIIIVSVPVGFILFIFILMVCYYCYWRRKRRLKRLKKAELPQLSSEEDPLLSDNEPDGPRRVASSGYLDSIAPEFVALVNVNELLPYLLQHQLLNRNEKEHLVQLIHTSMEKAQMLLDYLQRKRADSLQKFLCCLNLAREHIGHKEVADKLKQLMEANGINCTNFCSDNCKKKFAKSTS